MSSRYGGGVQIHLYLKVFNTFVFVYNEMKVFVFKYFLEYLKCSNTFQNTFCMGINKLQVRFCLASGE